MICLMIASKYPITKIDFVPFELKTGFDHFIGKGCLMTQIRLNEMNDCCNIFNTHLQSYQNSKSNIHVNQLDTLEMAIEKFEMNSSETMKNYFMIEKHPNLLVNLLAGDFNFDNSSPCDKLSYSHRLFESLIDCQREDVGRDISSTIGTEMRQYPLYDRMLTKDVDAFAESLKNDERRRWLIFDSNWSTANFNVLNEMPINNIDNELKGKRRVDRILYD
ncbi:hypothetical protein SNEBB_002630, partial [Seison nebaliae]